METRNILFEDGADDVGSNPEAPEDPTLVSPDILTLRALGLRFSRDAGVLSQKDAIARWQEWHPGKAIPAELALRTHTPTGLKG